MKQLFFSHTWQPDKLGRDTHNRVKTLVTEMQNYGWTCWFDEYDMIGNIDASMASGIDLCQCVIVCITESYCKKINAAAQNPYKRDNCLKEWNYAHNRNKLMIPIIMEPSMLNSNNWPCGVVPLHLGTTLYINCSCDYNNTNKTNLQQIFSNSLYGCIKNLHIMLLKNNLKPRLHYHPSAFNKLMPSVLTKSFKNIKYDHTRKKSKSCSSLLSIAL